MSMYGKYNKLVKGLPSSIVTDFEGEKSLTVQSDRDDADINKIIAKFEKTGTVIRMQEREPFYGDITHISDLGEAMEKVQKANDLFMSYPANVREKFDNDPRKFVEYFEKDYDYNEALELGLVNKRAENAPVASPVPEPGK